jgi:hypothetical protein
MKKDEFLTEYWMENYSGKNTLCTLCGNSGCIDTRTTAISPAGVNAGRLNYCICPNGRVMRKHAVDLEERVKDRERRFG